MPQLRFADRPALTAKREPAAPQQLPGGRRRKLQERQSPDTTPRRSGRKTLVSEHARR